MEQLYTTYHILLENTPMNFLRYYHQEINWDNRLIGLIGAKGVGKSTLILQHIKQTHNERQSLYIQADDLYFSHNRLFDTASHFAAHGGKYLYIDEIHNYDNWTVEVKQIYDQLPTLHTLYSGSSILDLKKGTADLSRRTREYTMPGLSYREYLNIKYGMRLQPMTLEEILGGNINFPYKEIRPLVEFDNYLQHGYYPFFQEPDFHIKLKQAIYTTIEEDIPHYAEMPVTAQRKLKTLLYVIAQSAPFKPNFSALERELNINRNILPDYLDYIEKGGLISILRNKDSGNSLLRKINKVYLDNPNIAYALSDTTPNIGNIRETVFLSWLRQKHNITASDVADFEIDDMVFEIGGKNKGKRQIANASNGYVIKDDIEYAFENTIPLWMFGFIY